MLFHGSAIVTALLLATHASAISSDKKSSRKWQKQVAMEVDLESYSTGTTGNATFEQYIDHDNPELGTFSQTYWWSTEYWGGPGSPVILFTPGEINASAYTGYLTNRTLTGAVAQEVGGAVILIEHRYWGYSSPFSDLTTENMQYLTLKNSISDFVVFPQNVTLPFDPSGESHPTKAPWLMMGGSYSGALSAWTASTQPETYWAYHASSAPVEAVRGMLRSESQA